MNKEFTGGWVIKVGKKYAKQKGGLTPLLSEAKFFITQKNIDQWQEENPGVQSLSFSLRWQAEMVAGPPLPFFEFYE